MASVKVNPLRGLVLAVMAAGAVLWSVPAAADAAATYKAKCAMCHGADGKGGTPVGKKMGVRDFSSPEVQKQPDAELTAITVKGKNKMPSYEKSLKPEEIKDLIAYIRQLASGK
jgi:mono/diheme cytochrome c family protein